MNKDRADFDYESLSFLGKLSLYIGNRRILTNLKKGNWLDVLCGYKSTLQSSQLNNELIQDFYSLDLRLSPHLKKSGIKTAEMKISKKLPYHDKTFENVTIINGLEHLENPQEILSECYRVLKPKGALQIIVPTWFGKPILEFLAFKLKNNRAYYIEMNDHKMYYDKKILWPMLLRAGFKPELIVLKRIKLLCSLYAMVVKK